MPDSPTEAKVDIPIPPSYLLGPAASSCQEFTDLVHYAWYATVSPEIASSLPIDSENGASVQRWLFNLRDYLKDNDEPGMADAMSRLIVPTLRTTGAGKFQEGVIYGRQMVRLCAVRGFSTPQVSPDVLTEYICEGFNMANPGLVGSLRIGRC